ncbi:hypothetical protein M8J76_016528 [Diaphorina citri]|nr:hypothetical protein M8J76_016528 [Diaphorina citri]KAI5727825.1 hypothetical protein M8J77_007313 [Diaphorina citri]
MTRLCSLISFSDSHSGAMGSDLRGQWVASRVTGQVDEGRRYKKDNLTAVVTDLVGLGPSEKRLFHSCLSCATVVQSSFLRGLSLRLNRLNID